MLKDNLFTGSKGRSSIMEGITKVATAVGKTMGTRGSNAIIEAIENPGHLMTNDGFTIANSIRLSDPLEEMGRKILLESINRANKESGDGSSTTCVLTAAILKKGDSLAPQVAPMEFKRLLESAVPLVEEVLTSLKREIDINDVGSVAAISAEDEEIGKRIQEIYEKIGKDGIIHWDISKTPYDSYTIGTGIVVEGASIMSPYLCDIDEKTGAFMSGIRWKNAKILLVQQKITSASEFNDLFTYLNNKEIKEVAVFCDEVEVPVIADLVKTRAVRGFKTALIKMPVLWKDWWYQDLAKATGATVIDVASGVSLKTMKAEHLGEVANLVVNKDSAFLDGIKDVTEYVQALEETGEDDTKLRASRLKTATAKYFVGAQSESALSYRRLKVEDALSAAWHALHGGIVAGGGSALVQLGFALEDKNPKLGFLAGALQIPAHFIAKNYGLDLPTWRKTAKYSNNFGLDTRTGEWVDMFEAKIVDPYVVVLNAVKNAISVAAQVLTANTFVTLPKEEPNPLPSNFVQI